MSTVATTRPTLSALSSLPVNGRRSVSPVDIVTQLTAAPGLATTTPTAPAFALFRHTMHPDSLLLQKHGVTSPRLSVVNAILKPVASAKRRSVAMSGKDQIQDSGSDLEREQDLRDDLEVDHVMIDDDDDGENEDDGGEEAVKDAAEMSRRKKEQLRRTSKHVDVCDDDDNDDDDYEDVDEDLVDERDAVSLCCSEDSELSVGQEDPLEVSRSDNKLLTSVQQTRRLLAVSDMMSLCRPSAFSNVATVVGDARSSVSTEDTLHLEDDHSVQPQRAAPVVLDPFAMAASALRMPVPIVPRPSTTQLQEELLRKSHQYAEELMKQQMQLMAAARASAFTLRQPAMLSGTDAKLGFRPQQPSVHLQTQPKLSEMPNFSGIHSHLTAISKMSQLGAAAAAAAAAASVVSHQQPQTLGSYNAGNDALAKLTAFGMGQTQTATTPASNLNQLQAQMQAHLPFMNNNLNEPALKFSIDNILKADFGRRITDPLLKRGGGSGSNGFNGTRGARSAHMQRNKKSCTTTITTPMDLTSQMTAAAAAIATSVTSAASTFSTTLANICTNSNDSSSTVVSSNYGNSDVLKSPASLTGATSTCSVSPAPPGAGGMDVLKTGNEVGTDGGGGGGGSGGSSSSSSTTSSTSNGGGGTGASGNGPIVWPAWVYCTRYSDRPSSGPRARKPKKRASEKGASPTATVPEDKRPRTAFSGSQLARLKHEFTENRYLTEKRRQQLSSELGLNEAQIKIWFQNKRAKLKKSSGTKNPLALQLMAQGLYNHSTVPLTREEEELQELQERENAASAGTASS